MTDEMHSEPRQTEARSCAYCRALFQPRRPWQPFCSVQCRNGYNADIGTQGVVASVRRINRGASIVVHLEGPAAQRALNLQLKDVVRIVPRGFWVGEKMRVKPVFAEARPQISGDRGKAAPDPTPDPSPPVAGRAR
jgi:hypothetical protein